MTKRKTTMQILADNFTERTGTEVFIHRQSNGKYSLAFRRTDSVDENLYPGGFTHGMGFFRNSLLNAGQVSAVLAMLNDMLDRGLIPDKQEAAFRAGFEEHKRFKSGNDELSADEEKWLWDHWLEYEGR